MTKEVHKGFWCGDMEGKVHLEDQSADGEIIIR
jgi:hypothetical protein